MNPDPFTDDVKEQERIFNDPENKKGWKAAMSIASDSLHQYQKIEDLKAINETFEQRIADRDETIAYLKHHLKQSWYRKLLNKLPRIRIEWKETI